MQSEPEEESHDDQVIDVIPVQFDDSYETVSVSSPQSGNTGAIKGKYYKQTYRTAWEQMPDFKGWLRGIQGQPTRAYCLYCQKSLHAHRLSLLKHTCTIRHQKAAQIHIIRQQKEHMEPQQNQEVILGMGSSQEDCEETEAMIEYAEQDIDDGDQEHEDEQDHEEVEEEEEAIHMDSLPVQFQKITFDPCYHTLKKLHKLLITMDNSKTCFRLEVLKSVLSTPNYRQPVGSSMSSGKPPISTHVLDTSKGVPVSGLQVSLYKLIEGRWTYINEGLTNPDGRFANFLERSDFTPGRYKLHYDVDRFFEARKQDTLYPFIEIVFDCRAPNEHYHVPLLLSPFGYTTYRGS